jgi:hypothetical protein
MSMLKRYQNKLRHELKRRRQKLIEKGEVKVIRMRVKPPKP